MVVLGVIDSLILLDHIPEWDGSILYYTNAAGLPEPPLPAIMMVLVAIIGGVYLIKNKKWPWMFVGAVFMLFAAGIPADLVGFFVSNAGEVIMGLAMVATEAMLQKNVSG